MSDQITMKNGNRICMLNPQGYVEYPSPFGKTDTGGQITYVLELAKALGKKGIKVDIITRQFDDRPQEEGIFENVNIVRIGCGPKKFVVKERLYEYASEMAENIMEYTQKKRKTYNLIHSHYWDGGYAGIMLAKMMGIPHVNTPHSLGKLKKLEMSPEEVPVQKLRPFYRYHVRIAIEQKIMHTASAIIVLSELNRVQIMQHYLTDFEKLHVIYPGVDTDNFNQTRTKYDKKLKLQHNAVLSVSRIAPAKGIDRLVGALALIKQQIPFHAYIGGDLHAENASEEERATALQIGSLIKKNRLTRKVTFIGNVPHDDVLPAYFRAADIFVLPSRFEPFGLTTIEAMACGTVPIVSFVAGSREVIVDGLNGFIVDTHDRGKLASLIVKLLKDEKLRKKISENAAFTIREHYSWDKIADQFIKLYKELE